MSYTTVAVTPGSGANIAVDRISSTDYQRVKLQVGVEGTATDVSTAAPLPVKLPLLSMVHYIPAATASGMLASVPVALKSVHVFSKRTTPLYVKFHNTATPAPGVGVVFALGVQAGTQRDLVFPDGGITFSSALGISVVTGIADTNTTYVDAEDAMITVTWQVT